MGIQKGCGIGSAFGKTFLILLNIVFAIFGIGLIVLGAYLRLNRGATDSRVIELLRQVQLGGINLGNVLQVLSILVIAVGVFTLLVAADGGFGACLRNKCLLIMYVVVLSLILIIEFALFVLWCQLAYGTNTWLKEQFSNLFRLYNGTQVTDAISNGWNLMFILLDCCGVSPISTFQNDFQQLNTVWLGNFRRGINRIPYSCCKEATVDNFRYGINPQCTVQYQFSRTKGCYEAFRKLLTDVSSAAIGVSVILLITEVLAILAAIFIIVGINREKRQTLDPNNKNAYKTRSHEIPLPDTKPR